MFGETLTRLRAPLETLRAGDKVRDWKGTLDELEVPGVSVQPLTQEEINDAQQRGTTRQQMRAYTRPWQLPDIVATDRVRWRGDTWKIDAPPQVWPDPVTGRDHHLVFVMERVEQ